VGDRPRRGAANFKRALSEGLSDISKVIERIQPALAVAKTRGTPADLEEVKAAARGLQEANVYDRELHLGSSNRASETNCSAGCSSIGVPVRRPLTRDTSRDLGGKQPAGRVEEGPERGTCQ